MNCYTQLTQKEKYHISVLCKVGFPKVEFKKMSDSNFAESYPNATLDEVQKVPIVL